MELPDQISCRKSINRSSNFLSSQPNSYWFWHPDISIHTLNVSRNNPIIKYDCRIPIGKRLCPIISMTFGAELIIFQIFSPNYIYLYLCVWTFRSCFRRLTQQHSPPQKSLLILAYLLIQEPKHILFWIRTIAYWNKLRKSSSYLIESFLYLMVNIKS